MSYDLNCHHCSHFIGEANEPMELIGMFKDARERNRLPEPRYGWWCGRCMWMNVFRPASGAWRRVELKQSG